MVCGERGFERREGLTSVKPSPGRTDNVCDHVCLDRRHGSQDALVETPPSRRSGDPGDLPRCCDASRQCGLRTRHGSASRRRRFVRVGAPRARLRNLARRAVLRDGRPADHREHQAGRTRRRSFRPAARAACGTRTCAWKLECKRSVRVPAARQSATPGAGAPARAASPDLATPSPPAASAARHHAQAPAMA